MTYYQFKNFYTQYFCICVLFSFSCQSDQIAEETKVSLCNSYTPEELRYYAEIGFGSEFAQTDINYIWDQDIFMRVYGWEKDSVFSNTIDLVIEELNELIDPIQINVLYKDEAGINPNAFFYIYSVFQQDSIQNLYGSLITSKAAREMGGIHPGQFRVKSRHGKIKKAEIFMYLETNNLIKKSIIREEIVQILGLMQDRNIYRESIFYETRNNVKEQFAAIDKKIIAILYNHGLPVGIRKSTFMDMIEECD